MNWQPCEDIFVDDIIRWVEPIWAPPAKKRGKPDAIGQQRITAAVTDIDDLVHLKVREIEVLSFNEGIAPQPLKIKKGDEIRRKVTSLAQGQCEKTAD